MKGKNNLSKALNASLKKQTEDYYERVKNTEEYNDI